eukprot:TRINITY_DN32608_c0_g1_i1.p1 TRINITY_DN32608_c0_g1~~TRINITY_DN32608_c0_g1_i1.p1  ORF type:complete len:130 (+),score=36.32 TRINITY_DN32608_c0_g1_i1:46-390(+)
MALQLQVLTLKGKTLKISASSAETVASLMQRIADSSSDVQKGPTFSLCFPSGEGEQLRVLEESQVLSACGIGDGSVLYARRSQHALWDSYDATYQVSDPPFMSRPRSADQRPEL